MRSHRWPAMMAVGALAAGPSDATAQPGAPAGSAGTDDEAFGFVAGHLGLGMPVGDAGVEAGVGIGFVRASVGVGMGFKGPQIMAAVGGMFEATRIGRYPLRFGLGLSFSRGPAVWSLGVGAPGESGQDEVLSFGEGTRWVSGEAGLELQVSRSATWRVYGGLSQPIYKECVVEIDDGPPEICDYGQRERLGMLPFVGTSVAWRIID